MKLRSDFVSNSSSSSFVVAVDSQAKIDNVKIVINFDLESLVEETLTTEEEVKIYFSEEYEVNVEEPADDYWGDAFKEALEAVSSGKKILIGSVCSDGESIENLLMTRGFGCVNLGSKAKIIKDCVD